MIKLGVNTVLFKAFSFREAAKAIALAGAGRREDAVTLIRQIQKMNGLSGQMRQRLADHLVTLGADPDPEAATHTAPDPTLAAEVVHPADED